MIVPIYFERFSPFSGIPIPLFCFSQDLSDSLHLACLESLVDFLFSKDFCRLEFAHSSQIFVFYYFLKILRSFLKISFLHFFFLF